jgi:hypothetical protein
MKCEEFSYKKNGWKVCFKLVGFSKFPTYFYMRTLINYDYDMKNLNTHWYISVLYPFESTKNSITIVLLSYFHILEVGMWHLLSCTCIYKKVLKCILKHAIIFNIMQWSQRSSSYWSLKLKN